MSHIMKAAATIVIPIKTHPMSENNLNLARLSRMLSSFRVLSMRIPQEKETEPSSGLVSGTPVLSIFDDPSKFDPEFEFSLSCNWMRRIVHD
jgi:hypothetical protein